MKLDWRNLSKEEQKELMYKNLWKLNTEQIVDVHGSCHTDMVEDIMEFAGDEDEAFVDTMDHIECLLKDKFYD